MHEVSCSFSPTLFFIFIIKPLHLLNFTHHDTENVPVIQVKSDQKRTAYTCEHRSDYLVGQHRSKQGLNHTVITDKRWPSLPAGGYLFRLREVACEPIPAVKFMASYLAEKLNSDHGSNRRVVLYSLVGMFKLNDIDLEVYFFIISSSVL